MKICWVVLGVVGEYGPFQKSVYKTANSLYDADVKRSMAGMGKLEVTEI